VLDTLTDIVKEGLQVSSSQDRKEASIVYNAGYRTNETTVVAPGMPTHGLYEVRNNIITASKNPNHNIINGKGTLGLGGSWGAHMTITRNLQPQEPSTGQQVAQFLDEQPRLGLAVPTAIEVGHFYVSPQNGFQFTPYSTLEL
jgi:hypothetical protein